MLSVRPMGDSKWHRITHYCDLCEITQVSYPKDRDEYYVDLEEKDIERSVKKFYKQQERLDHATDDWKFRPQGRRVRQRILGD